RPTPDRLCGTATCVAVAAPPAPESAWGRAATGRRRSVPTSSSGFRGRRSRRREPHNAGEEALNLAFAEAGPRQDWAGFAPERRRRRSRHEPVVIDSNRGGEHRRRTPRGAIEAVEHVVGRGLRVGAHLDGERHATGPNGPSVAL